MNIDEIRTEKKKLEKRLHNIINTELAEFKQLTGMSIDSIYINMLDVKLVGDKNKSCIVGNIETRIEL